jgi:GntR family transcriptional regulator
VVGETDLGRAAEEVRARILSYIANEEIRPGQRLGAEREMAFDLQVSRSTLRQALTVLEETGVIQRLLGRNGGTFVSPRKIDRDLSHIIGVPLLLRGQGFTAGTRLISAGLVLADRKSQKALGLADGDYNFDIVRIRLADGIPISLERARFPAKIFPDLLELPLGNSLYELLKKHYDTNPDEVIEHIDLVNATSDESRILEVPLGSPLFLVTRTTMDDKGRMIEYSHDLFRSDRTRITVRTKEGVSLSDHRGTRNKIGEFEAV